MQRSNKKSRLNRGTDGRSHGGTEREETVGERGGTEWEKIRMRVRGEEERGPFGRSSVLDLRLGRRTSGSFRQTVLGATYGVKITLS